jgi:hypothetical protein
MSNQRQHRAPRPIRRRLALGTAVIIALAIAAPAPGASAATSVKVWPAALWPYTGAGEFVYGGLVVGDVFNGGTTSVVSTGAAQGNTIGSP